MRNKVKRVISTALALCLIIGLLCIPANAAMTYYNSYTFKGGFLNLTTYTGKVYRDPDWFTVFYGNSSVSTGFEYKNNTNVILSQTTSFSIGSQTKKTLSAEVDFSGFGVPVNVGGSVEKTGSYTWGVSNTSTRTITASAPRGYYSYNVCINTYKIIIDKYKGSSFVDTITFLAPRSEPYRSIVYNPYNASYSGVSRY